MIEIYQSESLSTLNGYVKDADGLTVPGISVQLSYATSGAITQKLARMRETNS